MTVFYGIHARKEYKQLVQNRIDEIHQLTDMSDWRHCPGDVNPADLGSRGCFASELLNNCLWWEELHWLTGAPENYPGIGENTETTGLSDECTREIQVKVPCRKQTTLPTITAEKPQANETSKVSMEADGSIIYSLQTI